MSFFTRILKSITKQSSEPVDAAGNKNTNEVMSEFLEAFGPINEVRTEEAAILNELMPDVINDASDQEEDLLGGWGEKK